MLGRCKRSPLRIAIAGFLVTASACGRRGGPVDPVHSTEERSQAPSGLPASGVQKASPSAPEVDAIPDELKQGSVYTVIADRARVSLHGGVLSAQTMSWADVRRVSIV